MRPFLSIVAPVTEPVRCGRRERSPVERLLRDGLCGAMPGPDVPLLLDRLGDLDRWDDVACRGIHHDMDRRFMAHPTINERFVTDQLGRVGSGSAAGLRARDRWLASRLARFTERVEATYRGREWSLTSTHRAYLRALYVSCLMRANPGPTDDALAAQSFTRRSGP